MIEIEVMPGFSIGYLDKEVKCLYCDKQTRFYDKMSQGEYNVEDLENFSPEFKPLCKDCASSFLALRLDVLAEGIEDKDLVNITQISFMNKVNAALYALNVGDSCMNRIDKVVRDINEIIEMEDEDDEIF